MLGKYGDVFFILMFINCFNNGFSTGKNCLMKYLYFHLLVHIQNITLFKFYYNLYCHNATPLYP